MRWSKLAAKGQLRRQQARIPWAACTPALFHTWAVYALVQLRREATGMESSSNQEGGQLQGAGSRSGLPDEHSRSERCGQHALASANHSRRACQAIRAAGHSREAQQQGTAANHSKRAQQASKAAERSRRAPALGCDVVCGMGSRGSEVEEFSVVMGAEGVHIPTWCNQQQARVQPQGDPARPAPARAHAPNDLPLAAFAASS